MFDIEKEIKKLSKKHKKEIALVEKCKGIEKYVAFVNDIYIYTFGYSYSDCIKALHEISTILGLKFKLYDYYCGGFNDLHIRYVFGKDVFIIFLCNEPEKALKKLGKGKCRIVEVESKDKKVVCDV